MSISNITVAVTDANVNVDSTNLTVDVTTTTSNIVVGTTTGLSNTEIRGAISNVSPILYDSSTGVFSFDNTAIINATVVDNGAQSGNITLDLNAGRIHQVQLGTGNITGITFANIVAGASASVIFLQDGTGGTFLDTTTHASNFSSIDFANDFKDFDINPNNWTVMNIFSDGTRIYASLVTDSAGNITNAELANSNVVVNGVTIDLGSSGNITANMDLTALSVTTNTPSGNGSLAYNNTSGVFTFTPADASTGGIALTDISVTTASPSGNGALAYNNSTGVFSFTPSDVPDSTTELSEGTNLYFTTARANTAINDYISGGYGITVSSGAISLTNSEVQAQANVALGNNTTDALSEGSTNLYFTNARANTVIGTNTTDNLSEGATNLYFTTARANSAIDGYTGGLPNLTSGITMTSSSTFDPLTMQQDSNSTIGMDINFKKSRGGGVVNDNDRIVEWNYNVHDGSDYIKPLEAHVYVDSFSSSTKGTGIIPLAWEIHGKTNGDTGNGTGTVSMLRVTNDRVIVFNASGSRGFGNNDGNANITADGTFNTVASINATGNITGSYILGNGSALTGITTGIQLANLSVTQASASGTGTLAYNNGTGVFTYTPPDLSSFGTSSLTNAQAQAFIQSNGLSMTANADSTKSMNFTLPDTVENMIVVNADTPSSATKILNVTSARSADAGAEMHFRKATGSIASPGALGTRDFVRKEEFYGHDGTDYLHTFGTQVYHDPNVGVVSTNVVPLAYEIYCEQDGDVNHGLNQSIIRFSSDRKIIFNDTSTRNFGAGTGNANIEMDGSINTVSNITATGNVSGNYLLGNGSQLTGISGTYSNADAEAYFAANVVTSNINLQGNINVNKDIHTANAIFTDNIFSETPGGTFTLTSLRATDLGIGSPTFFFPDTGGNTQGAVLTAQANGVGIFNVGLDVQSSSGVDIITVEEARNSSVAIEERFKKARGSVGSEATVTANDRVHEAEYYGHDGTSYLMTIGEHVYVDDHVASITTNQVPLSKEFYVFENGIPTSSGNFVDSVLKIRSNRAVEFNAGATRALGSDSNGNANVTADGSINSVSTITGLNIKSNNFVQLKNYSTTEINALSGMVAGDTVFNTTENTICFYNGSAWHKVTSTAL